MFKLFKDDVGVIFSAALRFPVVDSDERQFFVDRFRQRLRKQVEKRYRRGEARGSKPLLHSFGFVGFALPVGVTSAG